MDTNQPIHLHLRLHISRNPIPHIQRPILSRLITNLQQLIHLTLIYTNAPRNLSKTPIRIISRLMHDISVKEVLLLCEQRSAEGVEVRRGDLEDGVGGFVCEGRGWVPGLDLLAEDGLDV